MTNFIAVPIKRKDNWYIKVVRITGSKSRVMKTFGPVKNGSDGSTTDYWILWQEAANFASQLQTTPILALYYELRSEKGAAKGEQEKNRARNRIYD